MNYKDYNDYEILYMIAEKDERATEIMYEKYKPIILSVSKKYFNIAQNVGIEYDDLIQEGMYGLSKAIKSYNDKHAVFYTYANVCITGHIQNLVRSSLAKKQLILNNSMSLSYTNEDNDRDLEETIGDYRTSSTIDQIRYQETSEIIKQFMYNLSDMEVCVFELKLNGFSNMEISKLLDKARRTVDNTIFRVKNKLSLYLSNC